MSEIDLNEKFLKEIYQRVLVKLDEYYEEPFDFVDEEGNVSMNDDDVECCLEQVLEEDSLLEIMPDQVFDNLLHRIWDLHREELLEKLSEIEEEIQSQADDYNLYRKLGHRAYYHYIYGLSEKDFM